MNIKRTFSKLKNSVLLKVGLLSSLFYMSFGGNCPCCGSPLTNCPVGLASAGIVGFLSSSFFHMIDRLSKMLVSIKKNNPFLKKDRN
jgi:hypothetical protein